MALATNCDVIIYSSERWINLYFKWFAENQFGVSLCLGV